MKAYWFDNAPGDHRLPHDSGRPVSSETLAQLGVLHHYYTSLEDVDRLAAARGYKNRDEVTVSPASMGDAYEAKVRIFFDEHLHEDEEIRYLLDGSGFFDVRSAGDAWIRIALAAGDLVVLPPGIYHRFTPDARDYTKAMRLFKDEPKWTPLGRSSDTDGNPFRRDYLQMRDGGAVPAV